MAPPLLALVLMLALPPAAVAQASASPQPPPQSDQPLPQAAESQGFTYDPGGRRDPFVNLIRSGGGTLGPTAGARPAGLAGLTTAEVTLTGTIQSQSGFVGILRGADNRTYIVRPGERLLDGTIQSITGNALVIAQQVNDPLSLEKQREVRKTLQQTDEAN